MGFQCLDLYMHMKIVVMSPAGPGNKNCCAGEDPQQYTRTELNYTYCHAL
jgi:hypothetical protein